MANKLFLVCTTLALCFLLTNASIYRTVVELDEEDETNPLPIGPFAPKQKCRREFQQTQHLRACQRFINKQAKQSRGPALDDDELDFEDDIENRPPWGQSPLLQQCCNELRQEEPVCVCPTLKQAAKAVRLQEQYQGPQARKIYKTAKYLPKVCKIPQVDVCPFFKIPFFPPFY